MHLSQIWAGCAPIAEDPSGLPALDNQHTDESQYLLGHTDGINSMNV